MDEETRQYVENTQVARVLLSRDRSSLRVYLEADNLIPRQVLQTAEQKISASVFAGQRDHVKIIEKFHLSEQYNARTLLPLYRDSILYELQQYNAILYTLVRDGQITFADDDTMQLQLEDSLIARHHSHELSHILEKIFCERCGQDLKLELSFQHSEKQDEQIRLAKRKEELEIQRILGAHRLSSPQEDGDELMDVSGRSRSGKPSSDAASTGGSSSGAAAAKSAGDHMQSSSGGASAADGNSQKDGAGSSGGQRSQGRFGGRGTGRRDQGWGDGPRPLKRSDDPDIIYGRYFEDDAITIDQIQGEIGEVTVRGKLIDLEQRGIRNEKTIIIMTITDFTDTILAKMFLNNDQLEEFNGSFRKGMFIKMKAVTTVDKYDSELSLGSIYGIRKIADFQTHRMDTWPEKRVELHCHTKMSDMDGVSDVEDILHTAKGWGHEAIAITDHGDVQAFPAAGHTVSPSDQDFKVIYGVEGYLVDDLQELAVNPKGQSLTGSFVVFDLETTGFSPVKNKIIEIGAVRFENGKVVDRFSTFVNPQVPIPYRIEQLTKINDSMVLEAPTIDVILPQFMEFCKGAVMVGHNVGFDIGFIEENCRTQGIETDFTTVDTVGIARVLLPQLGRYKLDTVAKTLGISLENHHRAVDDAECTAWIFDRFVKMLSDRGITDLEAMNELGRTSDERILKMPTYHIIILAKNDVGRVNLYRLVSWSHLQHYRRFPRIPKSMLAKYREGLIIGSACEAGELFQAVVRGASRQDLKKLVDFYDYLEIQPLGNNAFMTRSEDDPKTMEDLRDYNRTIVQLGDEYGKPVVATGDVHFLNPEDEIYRRIIMTGKGFKDADDQAPLYLRTTEEMLKEFDYLGSEKAREVVITNTVKIARQCERIAPVRPDKCPPVIENSDGMLRELCYNKAHSMYGENLPEIVEERLSRELNSIISNGFAVMYIIAQKLVWKSNADGYLVGSRGSVGSSFVATMSGVTEVNPLPPHYYCESCHFVDFDSPEVKAFSGMAGCDMPDRVCPVCGKPLIKDGFDIPFETFLGFKGNKEPDIDLNFSGEYQSKAHKYTEVIFGAGQTFRAGTIGTLADKTAFGYVKRYFEDHGEHKRVAEINRIVQGCVGVHRTTGQHPGGIIVLPYGEEIYSFTPIQHPANDTTTDIVTTHFDYHSIDHNLLKLDILGHDDPTMIRMLEDLTGLDAQQVPLDDQEVMSLFQSTKALGITPDQIGGCELGSMGIPEFGTDFAIQMLLDTKPRYFSDLIRIAGLAHGTDVWLGNAQTLIQEGIATISTAICCRDDIMIYLIGKGLDKELSFTIMEAVRKGKGLKPDWEEEMTAHDVPDWYIESCKKIKYMFPKAHAAAYVMMAWRIAWFKINRPLAYYAAYFSIRSPGFDYELMCLGEERLQMHIHDYEKRSDSLANKEQDQLKAMKVVREMYERGFSFMPVDIYRVQAARFQVIDGQLMPSLDSISGIGDNAAQQIVDAATDGPFLSKDDFRRRTKASSSVVDLLADLGILKGLPETNQLSLFDMM